MARTLYIPGKGTEIVFDDPAEALQKIIYEHLGADCETLYSDIVLQMREDSEYVAQAYLWMLRAVIRQLEEILILSKSASVSREELLQEVRRCRDGLEERL